ncbi:hypothetical protein I3271_09385 [Photobacterium leiognathi]|uniref:hypothetical protein n=1 Tax=Photobacterium leiognathi TaxID=553611 RepID=UPI001EDEE749|nr:hypothetical protein [Photobacterium leiognathi]MCG3884899.1 hypothetical protein [Photobacterium leiognathi]
MNETALKKEWLRLYETKKLPLVLAEVKKDIDRVNIYNSELYKELLRLQNADCLLPADMEVYDIKVKVLDITEDLFWAGSDESRISYDKIMEAVMSSEFLSTISVNENGKVEMDYYFHMKAKYIVLF